MTNYKRSRHSKKQKTIGAMLGLTLAGQIACIGAAHANDDQSTAMTAGLVMEKMKPEERYGYISGIVEGLAYARFRKDTIGKGNNDSSGMKCIYDWFYKDDARYGQIQSAFRQHGEHYPATLIAVMLKKECGE